MSRSLRAPLPQLLTFLAVFLLLPWAVQAGVPKLIWLEEFGSTG